MGLLDEEPPVNIFTLYWRTHSFLSFWEKQLNKMYALDTVHVFCDDFDTLLLELVSYAEHLFEQLFKFISNSFHLP